MFKTTIEITEDIEAIKQLLSADNFDAKTSKTTFQEQDKKLIIIIKSEDIVSLRASINGITTMLSVYYQTKDAVKE